MTISAAQHPYRLPWTLSDTIITWLEPTKECNMRCPGCFSSNFPGKHRPLPEVLAEIDSVASKVRTDVLAFAGGDPLCYPHIVQAVRHAAGAGLRPFVNTNGSLLDPALLKALKSAGLAGVCLHVDSMQDREGWSGADEAALNPLRERLGAMVRGAGVGSCYFNMTVSKRNLGGVPAVYSWALSRPDLVDLVLFVAFKTPESVSGPERIGLLESECGAGAVLAALAGAAPGFRLCAALPSASSGKDKWFFAVSSGNGRRYHSPEFFSAAQELSRRWRGRYLGRLRRLNLLEAFLAAPFFALRRGVGAADVAALFTGAQAAMVVQPETIVWGQKPRFFI